jgi:hypothetical protein
MWLNRKLFFEGNINFNNNIDFGLKLGGALGLLKIVNYVYDVRKIIISWWMLTKKRVPLDKILTDA